MRKVSEIGEERGQCFILNGGHCQEHTAFTCGGVQTHIGTKPPGRQQSWRNKGGREKKKLSVKFNYVLQYF